MPPDEEAPTVRLAPMGGPPAQRVAAVPVAHPSPKAVGQPTQEIPSGTAQATREIPTGVGQATIPVPVGQKTREIPTQPTRGTSPVTSPPSTDPAPPESAGPQTSASPAGPVAAAAVFASTLLSDRPRWLVPAAAGVLVAVLLLGAAAYAASGDVPRGTTVLGINLGGMDKTAAEKALRDGLAGQPRTGEPVPVRIGDKVDVKVTPAEVLLAVDVPATVAAASEGTNLFGTRDVPPVVTVDAKKLHDKLRKAAQDAKLIKKVTAASITFDGTTPKPVYPQPGVDLDAQQSADAMTAGWLRVDVVGVPLAEIHPGSAKEEVDRLLAEVAQPAVATAVTATTPRGDFSVTPAVIAKSLVLKADKSGKITPSLDAKKLKAGLKADLAKVEVKPREATVNTGKGKPTVVASSAGQAVDFPAFTADLLGVLPRADARTVAAKFIEAKPKTTTEDVQKLGIVERVSNFTTNFTGGGSSPRSQNIMQAARQVDGAIVKPGETFSLNGHTGERGYDKGYKDAPTIQDGKLIPGVGGGVSQFTTTLFNAAYYAGLKDVEHKPHSYYFSRYPAVIESTIFWPDLDLKFRNDTPYGVLIDTSYTNKSITVAMWSTKYYDSVKTEWGPRRAVTSPETVYLEPGPDCITAAGSQGFSQDAWRIFRKDGKELRREKFSWTYDAEPKFVCGKKPE